MTEPRDSFNPVNAEPLAAARITPARSALLGRPVLPRRTSGETGGDAARSLHVRTPNATDLVSASTARRCPLEVTLDLLGDRHQTTIVWHLFWGARPFCELMRLIDGIGKKTLRQALAEMERHGLVRREVRRGANRKAEYSLTPLGENLKLIVAAMYEWGLRQQQARPRSAAPLFPVRDLTPRA
jgi:DNA-binding HxlR family transcriptional regulator